MNKAAPHNSRMLQLEAALREAGFATTRGPDRHMVAHLEGGSDVVVTPISAGNGRPAEVRAARVLVEHEPPEGIPVLVARRFTPGALEVLEEAGLSYVDERRFIFRSREPYIRVDRMRSGAGTGGVGPPQVRLGGQVGAVVQAMLLGQEHGWRVTEVAAVAGVSVGTAQNAFRRLEELELVRVEGSGPLKRRWLTDRGRLLDLWAVQARAERTTLVTTFVFSQSPDDLARRGRRCPVPQPHGRRGDRRERSPALCRPARRPQAGGGAGRLLERSQAGLLGGRAADRARV